MALLSPLAQPQYYPNTRAQYGRQAGGAKEKSEDNLLAVFSGPVKGADKKSILLEAEGGNDVQFRVSRKTVVLDGSKKIAPQDLKTGTMIAVEARRFPDGSLDAVTVRVDRPAGKREQQQ